MAGALQRELRQTRPFPSAAEEATVGLLRTADRVRRRLTLAVAPLGITIQQYNVLRILRGAGGYGLPTLEIGARMIEEAPGVTRLIGRLEKKALAERRRCPSDARQVLCRITPAGLRLLKEADRPLGRAIAAAFANLGGPETRRLIHSLDALRSPLPTGGQTK
jgi:DNA-binding MarR family transcriptional regulator